LPGKTTPRMVWLVDMKSILATKRHKKHEKDQARIGVENRNGFPVLWLSLFVFFVLLCG